jgi:hypothetical protein
MTYKINPKWIKDLNIRPEIIRLQKNSTSGKSYLFLALAAIVLAVTPKLQEMKTKVDKWGYVE